MLRGNFVTPETTRSHITSREVSEINRPSLESTDHCIIHTHRGERVGTQLAALLDPVDAATFHEYRLPPNFCVELHRHEFDEYWWFTSGTPVVTLWTEENGIREYQLEPGDMVACLRGVAHSLRADHELVYFQFFSVLRPGTREGHLTEGVPQLPQQRPNE
jgi:mannose-6-phosphate isomerase-like protein (cupin superfamily)